MVAVLRRVPIILTPADLQQYCAGMKVLIEPAVIANLIPGTTRIKGLKLGVNLLGQFQILLPAGMG